MEKAKGTLKQGDNFPLSQVSSTGDKPKTPSDIMCTYILMYLFVTYKGLLRSAIKKTTRDICDRGNSLQQKGRVY